MPRDAAATRRRILAAAVAEFSRYGLAGARIDRIAEGAEANKRSIYVHYGSKERLFTAVLHTVIGDLARVVPLTPDDLPGYVGRMFDHLAAHPEAVRLSMWRQLERPGAGPEPVARWAAAAEAVIADRSRLAADRGDTPARPDLPAVDLLILVQSMAVGWLTGPAGLRAADGADPRSPDRLARHREALVEAVRRLVAPAS